MKRAILALALMALVAGCSKAGDPDIGYKDGYAVVINYGCHIRGSAIFGYWNNHLYTRNYARGATDAAYEIYTDGCAKWKE